MTFNIIEIEQGTPEWLALRRDHIGASEVAAIAGIDPYITAYGLWEQKVGLVPPPPYNAAMARGHAKEPELRAFAASHFGRRFDPIVAVSARWPWLLASLDGVNMDAKMAIECKAIKKEYRDRIKDGDIPPHIYYQVQTQLAVLGWDEVHLVLDEDLQDPTIWVVERDPICIQEIAESTKAFHTQVMMMIPPPITDRDYVVMEGPIWNELEENLMDAKAKADYWTEQAAKYRDDLIEMAGRRNAKGRRVKITAFSKRGSVDYGKIPELQGVDLDAYRKPSTMQCRLTYLGDDDER